IIVRRCSIQDFKESPSAETRRTPMANDKNRNARAAQSGADADVNSPGYQERVFEIVRRIPAGRVMTYGQLAEILGEGYTPRTVGFVMHAATDTVPWQRVINSQ